MNISILLSLFFTQISFAQENEEPTIFSKIPEKVFLHTNATTLLTGETLFYTFYAWNTQTNSLSRVSKIGYVELINNNGESVVKQKINLSHGIGHGDFFLPTTLKTGSYKLVAYTRWMLNRPVSWLFQSNLSVINPFQPVPDGVVIPEKKSDSLSDFDEATTTLQEYETNGKQNIVLKKEVYDQREKVTLILPQKKFNSGNYSLSVRKIDELSEQQVSGTKEFLRSINEQSTANKTHAIHENSLPEVRGEIIIGRIENKSNPKNVENKSIALSIPGKNFAFKIVNTDEKGIFRFILDRVSAGSNLVLQVMGDQRENFSIELFNVKKDFSNLNFGEIALSTNLSQAIKKRMIAVQIQNAYFQQKKDSIIAAVPSKPFYFPLAKEYILENYTSFPSLEETIIEIPNQMYATKKNGNYTIHTRDYYNEETQGVYGKTLVLVDGLLLQDVNALFEYDTRKIHKISLVPRGYIYGPKIFDGVVNFITKEQDFEGNLSGDFVLKKELLRPLPEKIYFNPKYTSSNNNERIPDYRYQLLWLPELSLVDQKKEISFFTSDVKGLFEISIEGFTTKGDPVSLKTTFRVK